MAQALQLLSGLRAPGRRVAVWAHNGHLAYATDRTGLRGYFGGRVRGMGTILRARSGKATGRSR